MCSWWCWVCFLHFLKWLVFVGNLLHNFLSCNSNECLPPRPQLLRKGRIYCCWTCTQADHKSGRCFLFLAHWEFYWLLYFFSLHFFISLKVRARCCEGEMLSLGIQKFVSLHLSLSWWTESWKGWLNWWCWKEDVLWKDTKSWSNYAFGSGHFVQRNLAGKVQWSSLTKLSSFYNVHIVSACIFAFSKKMRIGRRNLRRKRKETYLIWIGTEIEHLEKIRRRM